MKDRGLKNHQAPHFDTLLSVFDRLGAWPPVKKLGSPKFRIISQQTILGEMRSLSGKLYIKKKYHQLLNSNLCSLMSQNTTENRALMVKSWWFVMFVMVFVVETIKICDGFILFNFFSRDISLYQLYSGITLHSCPLKNNECMMPLTLQYKIMSQINETWWNIHFSWNCYRLLEIAVIHDMVKNNWMDNT